MALSEEQFAKLHDAKVDPVEDATSRYSYKVTCSCGLHGLFFTKEDAERYRQFHLDRKRMAPY